MLLRIPDSSAARNGVANASFFDAVAVSPEAFTIFMEIWLVTPYFMPTTGSPDLGSRSDG